MKKYLITAADIRRIKKGRDVQGSWTAFNALAPIEPLSEIEINAIYRYETGFDMHTGHGSDIALLDFAKAIERRILGETE